VDRILIESLRLDFVIDKTLPVTLSMGKHLSGGGTLAAAYTLVDSKTSPAA
jgi:hypothetical protein